MSDTPRTDHLMQHARTMAEVLDECEKLERELARAMRVVEAARKWFAADRGRYESTILEDAVEEWEAGR